MNTSLVGRDETHGPSRIRRLDEAGVSVWLDNLSRTLIENGTLERYITHHALSGVTSNPTIFATALHEGDRYNNQLGQLIDGGLRDPQAVFFALALRDVRDAARLLRPTYERSGGRDGYVSFECTPDVVDEAWATIRQAQKVWDWVDAPNLMIKVPATSEGIAAIEELTVEGINVNVTLLFGAGRHAQAARAYQRGLARRARQGEQIHHVRSVASLFVSRVDARVDELLDGNPPPRSIAIANARSIYRRARAIFDEEGWRALRARGAQWQRPLWASTAPKSRRLRDVAYVEGLALPDTIVTVPEKTLLAFADHGTPTLVTLDERDERETLAELARGALDLEVIASELESAGLCAFRNAYAQALHRIGQAVDRHQRGQEAA